MAENIDQRALRLWLTAGLAIPEVAELNGDAGYLINNMVAKYSLAADEYRISTAALGEFLRRGVNLKETWTRRRFYGRGSPYKYEHIIPAGIIRDALIDSDRSEATVRGILENAGFVAVLLRSEDDRLKAAGLNNRMPFEWRLGDDPIVRYQVAGIELSTKVLRVSGAIMR